MKIQNSQISLFLININNKIYLHILKKCCRRVHAFVYYFSHIKFITLYKG